MGLAKIVFWKYQKNKKEEHPIFIRVIEDRKARYIKTGFSVKEDDWDFKEDLFRVKYRKTEEQHKVKEHERNNEILEKKLREANRVIKDLIEDNRIISSEQVKEAIVKEKNRGKTSVLNYIDKIVEDRKNQGNIGTAQCYKDLKRSLKKFIEANGKQDITFKEISFAFLKSYEQDFRNRSVKDTGISFYMRSLRAVFNSAIEEGACKREVYPFDKYKISKLKTDTTKRAISKDDIAKIVNLKIDSESTQYHSRNYFLFSYYNRGINFSDMAMLKWKNLVGNRLIYIRLKTKKPYNVLLLEPSIKILEYYRANFFRGEDSFIFPILDESKHITPTTIKNRIHKILGQTNEDLKDIGKEIKLNIPLTTYVARHTFATVMKRSGVSTSIISEALGHDSERTTQIYLDSFENDVLDEASRALL